MQIANDSKGARILEVLTHAFIITDHWEITHVCVGVELWNVELCGAQCMNFRPDMIHVFLALVLFAIIYL